MTSTRETIIADDAADSGTGAGRRRGRDAAATRGAILAAARRAFTADSYDRVGLREIAAAAGIDPALVIRYFGSKEGLFKAAVGEKLDLSHLFAGDLFGLGERLARLVLTEKPPAADGFDPMLALLRSAPSEEPGRLLWVAIEEGVVGPLAARLPGPGREVRAGLIAAVLVGVLVSRSVVRTAALAEADAEDVIGALAPVLQRLVDGE